MDSIKSFIIIDGYFDSPTKFVTGISDTRIFIAECQNENQKGYSYILFYEKTPKEELNHFRRINDIYQFVTKCNYYKIDNTSELYPELERVFREVIKTNKESSEVAEALGYSLWKK